jgi:mannitol-1-phosphate 5-dehydrogenase
MKKAVQYGAGNIGRGFIGQLFSQSGYEVVFIDVDKRMVDTLNNDRKYPVKVVSDKGNYEIIVENVRAVNGVDLEAAAKEISEADIMATAVGVNILPKITGTIVKGLKMRWKNGNTKPLNIIICENLIDADRMLAELISRELDEEEKVLLKERVGFVEASIGRMVPVMTPEMQEGNILRICVEEYDKLPVDKNGFIGDIPPIKNLIPFTPFEYYIQRKLFIHNMAHALLAYLGNLKGFKYIWEAVEDEYIRSIVTEAMNEAALALSKEHGVEFSVLKEHVEDLIIRFGNHQLGDTVERVGRDLKRKLSQNDRLAGAIKLCKKNGVQPTNICIGVAAALHFTDSVPWVDETDFSDPELVLEQVCGLERDSIEWNSVRGYNYLVSLLKNINIFR